MAPIPTYLALLAEEDPRKREELFGPLSRGWVIGSTDFSQELRQRYAATEQATARFGLLGADPLADQQVRALAWEDALQDLARRWKIDLGTLPPAYSAAEKVRLAAALKGSTSVSNGWLAERLGMGKSASVSQFVRRFRLGGGDLTAEFTNVLSRVKA